MRHPLLPKNERTELKRDYRRRLIVVWLVSLAIVAVIAIISLLPAYIRAKVIEDNALTAQRTAASSAVPSGGANVLGELKADEVVLERIATTTPVAASELIMQTISLRDNVTLESFVYQVKPDQGVDLTVEGLSPTRQDLLDFMARLIAGIPGAQINLPISDLTKVSNVDFAVNISVNAK